MQKNIFIKDFIYLIIIFLLTTGIYFLYLKNSNLDVLLNQNTNQIEELRNQINLLKEEIIEKAQPVVLPTKTTLVESQIEPSSSDYSWVLFAFIGLILTYRVFGYINLYHIPGLSCSDATPGPFFSETTGLFIKAKRIEGSPFYDYFVKPWGEGVLTFDEFLFRFAGGDVPKIYYDTLQQAVRVPPANLDQDTWSFLLHSSSWPGGSPLVRMWDHNERYYSFMNDPGLHVFEFTDSGIAQAVALMRNDPDLLRGAVDSVLSIPF